MGNSKLAARLGYLQESEVQTHPRLSPPGGKMPTSLRRKLLQTTQSGSREAENLDHTNVTIDRIVNEGCQSPPTITVSAIRAQLKRVLEGAPMRNSKRCRSLLRYVVGAAIEGRIERVKERIIGIEVFGRHPDYDTNEDSVDRHAAGEVRKRLAQYYLEPGHEKELRIVLPQGGYVPEFCPPPPVESPLEEEHAAPLKSRTLVRWGVAAFVLVMLTGIWFWGRGERDALHRFWAPILDDPADVVVCIGQPARVYNFGGPRNSELDTKMVGLGSTPPEQADVLKRTTLTLGDLSPAGKRYLFLGDSLCLIKVTTLFASHGKGYVVRGVDATAFQDLRGSPVVLIGLNNNRWTVNLEKDLRYYFVRDHQNGIDELRDRQNGNRPRWSRPTMAVDDSIAEDYAIVSRVFDASTEKTVVTAAGLRHFGTLAAGDFLANEAYLREAFRNAPPNWHRRNIQVVLTTKVVEGAVGPPKVVATHFW